MQNTMVFTFGVIGNLVSFCVFLAPSAQFYKIFKKKTTQGFKCVPYVVALLSSMLWIYYALVKTNETLLITINSIGCFMEAIYISIFITYASKKSRIKAVNLLVFLNIVGFGSILVLMKFIVKEGALRVQVLGWICVALAAAVYIVPLSIMKQVISTKSVEFMPISLSFALLVNSVIWFFYGLLLKDIYIAIPNIVGFIFGVLQIVLYLIYKNCKVDGDEDNPTTMKSKTTTNPDLILPVCSSPIQDHDQNNLELIIIAEQNGGETAVEPNYQRTVDDDHEPK